MSALADVAVAHLALELGARDQRRHGVNDEDVDGAGTHERIGDLERLLAGIGLRDQQLVDIDAELRGIDRVERMLRVDEGAGAALLLRLRDRVQRQRGLAGGFRPVDLDDAAAGEAADAKRDVQRQRARRDDLGGIDRLALAEAHDRALAEGALDLAERRVEGLGAIGLAALAPFGIPVHSFLLTILAGDCPQLRNAHVRSPLISGLRIRAAPKPRSRRHAMRPSAAAYPFCSRPPGEAENDEGSAIVHLLFPLASTLSVRASRIRIIPGSQLRKEKVIFDFHT